MSMCPYCEKGSYFGFCTCIKNGNICPFMRRCNMEHTWLPIDSMNTCTLREPERVIELKSGEYLVRFEKDGDLYIEVGDYVIYKKNPYDYVPEKVEMVQIGNEMYFKGFEPKEEEQTEKKSKKKTKK